MVKRNANKISSINYYLQIVTICFVFAFTFTQFSSVLLDNILNTTQIISSENHSETENNVPVNEDNYNEIQQAKDKTLSFANSNLEFFLHSETVIPIYATTVTPPPEV